MFPINFQVFDDEEKLTEKAILLANWIKQSKHCVLYCGAGLSTAAGIPDFRCVFVVGFFEYKVISFILEAQMEFGRWRNVENV